jgi:hypothetical protein
MADRFGEGLYLDDQLDFSVDPSGDLQSASGVNELQKDLSFQMIFNLEDFIGKPPSGNIEAKIINIASKVAIADSRVTSVSQEKSYVRFGDSRQSLELNLVVRTVSGEINLIFNV